MIDTHCHPYMNKQKNINTIIDNFFVEGGTAAVIIGTNEKTSKIASEITKKRENIYASIGIHPCDVEGLNLETTLKKLEKIYVNNKNKIKAIGEIGLDYYWIKNDAERLENEGKIKNKNTYILKQKELQAIFFKSQILFAKTYNLPIIIHNRDAKDDIFQILKEIQYKKIIFHCWSEDYDFAKKILKFSENAMISFSGIITFKNAENVQKTAKLIPENNILAETDSPFLTPVPFRGKEENEPKFTKYIIQKISELRNKDMGKIIEKNSKNIFNI